ncbi:MAG: DUF554 domain-containing protein [Herpetosiphonaceae bacterium]|nr:DUF554 domain-containing protein [Herpetosiphonaceae bacterium]
MLPIGTLLNVGTVLLGTLLGSSLGNRLPERMHETTLVAVGLITLALGFKMGLQTHNILITLGSLATGGMLGEVWCLDAHLDALGRWVEAKVTVRRMGQTGEVAEVIASSNHSIAHAFVTASLIFCVGPVTVLGAINDGAGDYQLLAIKALLDGIASIALASSLGWGVGLAAITVFVFQGAISLVSWLVGQSAATLLLGQTVLAGGQALPLGTTMIAEMTAVGGMVIIGLGLILLDLKRIRIANFLPSLALAPVLVLLLHWFGVPIAP